MRRLPTSGCGAGQHKLILSSSPRGRQKVGDNLDLVGAHQGRRLTVTSEPGKGSEFTVRLPGGGR